MVIPIAPWAREEFVRIIIPIMGERVRVFSLDMKKDFGYGTCMGQVPASDEMKQLAEEFLGVGNAQNLTVTRVLLDSGTPVHSDEYHFEPMGDANLTTH